MEFLFAPPEKRRVLNDIEQPSASDVLYPRSQETSLRQTVLQSVLILLLATTVFVHLQNMARNHQFFDDHLGRAILVSSSAFLVLILTLYRYWPETQPSDDRLSIVSKRLCCVVIWLFTNLAITLICYCFIVYGNGGSPMDERTRIPEVYTWGVAGEALYLSITGIVVLFIHYWNLMLLKGSASQDRLAKSLKRFKYTGVFLFASSLLYGLAFIYVLRLAPREDRGE